jgi:hypothetical protein
MITNPDIGTAELWHRCGAVLCRAVVRVGGIENEKSSKIAEDAFSCLRCVCFARNFGGRLAMPILARNFVLGVI